MLREGEVQKMACQRGKVIDVIVSLALHFFSTRLFLPGLQFRLLPG